MNGELGSVIQNDFGGFNPRFFGITLRFQSPESYEYFERFLKNHEVPRGDSIVEIGLKSVVEHEIRHYHDFLLSPYVHALFRLRIQCLISGCQVPGTLNDIEGNVVPVPLIDWIKSDELWKKSQEEDWRNYLKDVVLKPIKTPSLSTISNAPTYAKSRLIVPDQSNAYKKFESYVIPAMLGYEKISDFSNGFNADNEFEHLIPPNFYEVTALTVQIETILHVSGGIACMNFLNAIFQSDFHWAKLWRDFWKLSAIYSGISEARSGAVSLEQLKTLLNYILTMSTWCILGNYKMDRLNASPDYRFAKLMEFMFSSNNNDLLPTSQLWDLLDMVSGVSPWRESLKNSLDSNLDQLSQYRELKDLWKGDKEVPKVINRLFEEFVRQQKQLIDHVISDPDSICDPNKYINSSAREFPSPVYKFELEGFGLPLERVPAGAQIIHSVNTEFGKNVTEFAKGPYEELTKTAVSFEWWMYESDFLFTHHVMPNHYYSDLNRILRNKTGKHFFHCI